MGNEQINGYSQMGFTTAVKSCFSKYATFTGRARRSEYWFFVLFNILVEIVVYIPGVLLVLTLSRPQMYIGFGLLALMGIFALAVIIPGLAVIVRRLHDTGRSGWWYFISLVPFVGGIILLVFLCTDSQPGENKWGPNPKGE